MDETQIQFTDTDGNLVVSSVDLSKGVSIIGIELTEEWKTETEAAGVTQTTDWLGNLPKPRK